MELIAFLFVWAIITIVGHGSWVMIRGFFRMITDSEEPRHRHILPDEKADIEASRRVVQRMVAKGLLDESAATEIHDQLRNLQYQQTTSTIHPSAQPSEQPITPANHSREFVAPTVNAATVPADEVGEDAPILAALVDDEPKTPVATPPFAGPPLEHEHARQPAPPVLSRSEVIQSFLAAHNIRWGELVAGILIVVCSIGLVISLWSPLVETHRVIPSLIFLGANAAIYAAGLYTLSRWRLRHTSRAVLVIATLLVPLSVLAGLAAAGTTAEAVQLTDPITLGAIALASAIYIFLLYLGGKALSGRWHAAPIVMSVAGPVAILPLVPASVRAFGASAGWIIGIGSVAILLASIRLNRLRKHPAGSMGVAGGRSRLLVMAFAGFSLAVVIGYAAFALRESGLDAMLAIAVAAIPALVALAGTSRSLMASARSSTQSMTGAVVCVVLIGLAWTILPPSMTAASWVWSWALVFSISAAVVGSIFHQPRWLALCTLPIGMAATFSAPVWLGEASWAMLPLWKRIVGGEPMIAASLVTIAVAAASRLIRNPDRRRWMGYAAIFWAGVCLTIAALLSIAPLPTLGVAPWWSVTCVLVAGSVASIVFALRHHAWSFVAIGTTVFSWLSVFRPIQWNAPLASPSVWMTTSIAIAITMLVLREFVPRLALAMSRAGRTTLRSARTWELASNVASIVAGVIACVFVRHGWSVSAATLAATSALLFWSSTTSRSIDLLRLSQIATIALSVVIGYGRFWGWLFDAGTWAGGTALWAWAVLAGIVAGVWVLIREGTSMSVAALNPAHMRRRFRHLQSEQAAPARMPDGWMATTACFLACSASAWAFAALLSQACESDLVTYDSRVLLPVSALLMCGAVSWWMRRLETDGTLSDQLVTSVAVASAVWISSQLAHVVSLDATGKLVMATTLAAAACLAVCKLLLPRIDQTLSKAADQLSIVVAATLIAVSSMVLLLVGWFEPIIAGAYAHKLPTFAVATWWMIGAAALLWATKQTFDSASGRTSVPHQNLTSVVSAILAPAAVAIVVPVFSLPHPAVWVQVAAITSVIWIAISRVWFKDDEADAVRPAIDGSMLFALVVGIVSSLLVTISIVLDVRSLHPVFGPAGFIISVLTVVLWCFRGVRLAPQRESTLLRLPWPVGLSILAGQFGWLAYALSLVSGAHLVELVAVIWSIASVASLVAYRSDEKQIDFIHVGLVTVAITILTGVVGTRSELMPWLALATLAIGGIQVAFVGTVTKLSEQQRDGFIHFGGFRLRTESFLFGASRLLGWFVVTAGGLILVSRIATGMNAHVQWTMLVMWSAIWVVAWRLICPDKKEDNDRRRNASLAIPDMELAGVVMLAVIGETILFTLSGRHSFQTTVIADPLLWGRVVAYVVVGASALARAGRNVVWSMSIGTLVASAAFVSVQISIHLDATSNQRFVWATLPAGFAVAFIAHWLPAIARLLRQVAIGSASIHLSRLVQATWHVALVVASVGGTTAGAMIASGAPAADTNLTIIAVALAAWAIAEMAEACNGNRLRHAAVTVALIAIGLWASVDSGETSHPILTASMRWLVASVFTIPMLLFVFPKLLGETVSARWREAFHGGAMIAGIAAGCSLIGMLGMEAAIRTEAGIHDISRPIVIGVAVTLSILSGLAGLIAILSGPHSSWRDRFEFSDQHRMYLIVAAQVIGGIAWLHVFLCKTHWAFIGLRAYWPYIVMGLAFVSVGVTEWARRRSDEVLSRTLAHTALYLPLIPVVGFWLSGDQLDWAFRGGRVRYDLLLAIGSVYYIGISSMWKGLMPRVTAVVLGNAAWWVVLVQQPGWSFLAHPQAWLIPPAVCVLVVAHLYRDRLEPAVASGVRYASTLVIYISSTADMLLQQIGTNLSGPIILVLLALVGMAAGVVFRVRPFLYLGAMFVFLGVTSMVWHAHLAIDAVWPWWVFGITTGMCLLAGLMALEKNKPKLREYANQLATWQG